MLQKLTLALCFLASCFITLGGCKSGDHFAVPTPEDTEYVNLRGRAIKAVSDHELFVCGTLIRRDGIPEGLMMRSEDGGRGWSRMGFEANDLKRVSFQSLYFADRLRGWVGGVRVVRDGGTRAVIYNSNDGGNHWTEVVLPMDPNLIVTEVYAISFEDDDKGAAVVRLTDPTTATERDTFFNTEDAGGSWQVVKGMYRIEAKPRTDQPTNSFINEAVGFRLNPGPYPGVTFIETTASGGKDWLPVHEMSLAALSTYY